MKSPFEEFEQNDFLTDKEIFLLIWTDPKRVLKYIHDKNYEKYAYILLFLIGVGNALDNASTKNMGDKMSIGYILLIALLGGLFGWIGLYIYSAMLSVTGKWLGAKGDTDGIYRVLPYTYIPSILGLLFILLQMIIFGNEVFKDFSSIINDDVINTIVYYILVFIELGLSLYSVVLLIILLMVVQKISVWKAIFNAALPLLIIAVPLLLLYLMLKN